MLNFAIILETMSTDPHSRPYRNPHPKTNGFASEA